MTDQQREALVKEVFHRITIDGKEFSGIQPNLAYVPLFGTILTDEKLGYHAVDSSLGLQQLDNFAGRLMDTRIVAWVLKAA